MSLSPEGRRRLIKGLGLSPKDADDMERLMKDVWQCQPDHQWPTEKLSSNPFKSRLTGLFRANSGRTINCRCVALPLNRPNWPSQITQNTNSLEAAMRGERDHWTSIGGELPAARRSPERLKAAVGWWFARAEARRIIERMMQP